MADEKLEDRAKRSSKAARKKAASKKSAKKDGLKKSAAKQALRGAKAKSVVLKKVSTRKPVSSRTARVGKRAILPPLPPPPTVLLKATRNPVRRPSRVNALLRNKGAVKSSRAAYEVAVCTEAALREKLRIAAPYVEIWRSRRDSETSALDAPTPEAAFVRIWQWLTLEAVLDDRRIVTPDLIDALFADEVRGDGLQSATCPAGPKLLLTPQLPVNPNDF
jgi:hypothetical protein